MDKMKQSVFREIIAVGCFHSYKFPTEKKVWGNFPTRLGNNPHCNGENPPQQWDIKTRLSDQTQKGEPIWMILFFPDTTIIKSAVGSGIAICT